MNWYTIWLRKTGELVASGTGTECARRLGYASRNSFYSVLSHHRKAAAEIRFSGGGADGGRAGATGPAQQKKRARRCDSTDEPCKVIDVTTYHQKFNTKRRILQ